MDGIVDEALERADEEQRDNDADIDGFGQPQIAIVGCGGAGNNTVNRLHNIGVEGATTIALNTDEQHLRRTDADTHVLVGKSKTDGLGAGGDPSVGRQTTKQAQGTIKEALNEPDLVFITAGMGGGTGTGAAPVVAEIAKDEGAVVVSMVSTPFNVERARVDHAKDGLKRLRKQADSVIVLDNNRLVSYVPDLPIGKAFSVMDQIISETVKGISETITQESLINLDYADMTNVMDADGVAVMLVGETQSQDKSDVVDEAMNHPLLDVDYNGATGSLVHITGGPDMTINEATNIAEKITHRLGRHANVIWGARINEDYKGKARVMAIMTGIDRDNADLVNPDTGEEPGQGHGQPRQGRQQGGQRNQRGGGSQRGGRRQSAQGGRQGRQSGGRQQGGQRNGRRRDRRDSGRDNDGLDTIR